MVVIVILVVLVMNCITSYQKKIWTSYHKSQSMQSFPTIGVCNIGAGRNAPMPINKTTVEKLNKPSWCELFRFSTINHSSVKTACKSKPIFNLWENWQNYTIVNMPDDKDDLDMSYTQIDDKWQINMFFWLTLAIENTTAGPSNYDVFIFRGTQNYTLVKLLVDNPWTHTGTNLKLNPQKIVQSRTYYSVLGNVMILTISLYSKLEILEWKR